jgi:hypothetical protein
MIDENINMAISAASELHERGDESSYCDTSDKSAASRNTQEDMITHHPCVDGCSRSRTLVLVSTIAAFAVVTAAAVFVSVSASFSAASHDIKANKGGARLLCVVTCTNSMKIQKP